MEQGRDLMTLRARPVGWHVVVALAAATLLPACAGVSSKTRASDAPPHVSEERVADAAWEITGLPTVDWKDHNPAAFVRVANRLRALGEGPCLEALERASEERPDAVIALVCVLFDSTRDGEPRPTLTGPLEQASLAERFLREQHPDFPVVWVAGIPVWADGLTFFVPNWAEEFTGFVEEPWERRQDTGRIRVRPFLDWARQDARLAAAPLHLPDDPAAAVSAYFENDEHIVAWKEIRQYASGPDYLENVARRHGYAALDGLLDDEVADDLGFVPAYGHRIGDDDWSALEAIVSTSDLRWDRVAGRYARRDE